MTLKELPSKKIIANKKKAVYHKIMSKHEHYEKSPKLTVPQIIEYCKKDLGLTFNLMDEETAAEFLRTHNYFFRLKQYAEVCQDQERKQAISVRIDMDTIDWLKEPGEKGYLQRLNAVLRWARMRGCPIANLT